MTVRYAVVFEFEGGGEVTHRGIADAETIAECVALATADAEATLAPVGWSLMFCVVLERLDDGEPDTRRPDARELVLVHSDAMSETSETHG